MLLNQINYTPLEGFLAIRRNTLKSWIKNPWLYLAACILLISAFIAILKNQIPVWIFFTALAYGIFEIYIARIKDKLWRQFANINNWRILEKSQVDSSFTPSCLLLPNTSHKIKDVVEAKLHNTFYIYELEMKTKREQKSDFKFFTIARIKTSIQLPHIVLSSKKTSIMIHTNSQKISLEGNFDQYFSMTIDKDNQVDALSIITPDVMQALIDYDTDYDIEIFGDSVYLLVQCDYRNPNSIKGLLTAVDTLADEIMHKAKTANFSTNPNTIATTSKQGNLTTYFGKTI